MIKHDFVIHSQGPSGRLKTSGFALGFQHFPRDLANVNEWKIMFDPSNNVSKDADEIAKRVKQVYLPWSFLIVLFLASCDISSGQVKSLFRTEKYNETLALPPTNLSTGFS